MKVVTSVGIFDDAIGKRISFTYSEIDESGTVISDNNRVDRVVTNPEAIAHMNAIKEYAATLIQD